MAEVLRLVVREAVGVDCLRLEDGWFLYKAILPAVQGGERVELDFAGVYGVSASFFNSLLGYMLKDFEPGDLAGRVMVKNLSPWAKVVMDRVLRNCWRHYRGEGRQGFMEGAP